MITQKELKTMLHYDPETGLFTRLTTSTKGKIGSVAGGIGSGGYRRMNIKSGNYAEHRLAWLYVYGEFPSKQLDHINNIKTDNRIINLREATYAENGRNRGMQSNNTSGYIGVTWSTAANKWHSKIKVDGKTIYLGVFDIIEDAYAAYQSALEKYNGKFRHPSTI